MTESVAARPPVPRDGAAPSGPSGRSWSSRLRLAVRRPEGLPWWAEIVLLYGLYLLYTLVRNSLGDVSSVAMQNARAILAFEDSGHLAWERGLNEWVSGSDVLSGAVALHYATLHFIVTPAVLIWLYRRRRDWYRLASTVWMTTTVVALVAFYLVPTAPPRLLASEGFVDVMSTTSSWGWWPASGAPASDALSNQFAAMPSLHCAWAVWCGAVIVLLVRRTWVRVLGVVYPLTTFFVVMGSGNHFLLDVVGGVGLLGLVSSVLVLGARQLPLRRLLTA